MKVCKLAKCKHEYNRYDHNRITASCLGLVAKPENLGSINDLWSVWRDKRGVNWPRDVEPKLPLSSILTAIMPTDAQAVRVEIPRLYQDKSGQPDRLPVHGSRNSTSASVCSA